MRVLSFFVFYREREKRTYKIEIRIQRFLYVQFPIILRIKLLFY